MVVYAGSARPDAAGPRTGLAALPVKSFLYEHHQGRPGETPASSLAWADQEVQELVDPLVRRAEITSTRPMRIYDIYNYLGYVYRPDELILLDDLPLAWHRLLPRNCSRRPADAARAYGCSVQRRTGDELGRLVEQGAADGAFHRRCSKTWPWNC